MQKEPRRAPTDPKTGMKLGCTRCNRWRKDCDLESPCSDCREAAAGLNGREPEPLKCVYTYKVPFASEAAAQKALQNESDEDREAGQRPRPGLGKVAQLHPAAQGLRR